MTRFELPRVLLVHNAYQQRGGEDSVVEAEGALLRSQGHTVVEYRRSNDELRDMSNVAAARQTFWSSRTVRDVRALLREQRIDVVHCHNTFPLISPAVYWASAAEGVPVVQTLHNFRLVCPQALMLRDERPCEDCVGRSLPWPAVQHACYRGSRLQSAVLVGMLASHRALGTWRHKVARYIALNDFCRQRFIAGGLPAERVVVKPNFADVGPAPDPTRPREGVLFVGRLSHEKGIGVLAQALHRLNGRVPVTVVGDGPLAPLLSGLPQVRRLGSLPAEAVMAEMWRARLLVLPSICYENFPRTLAESFGCGLPVLASRIGALASLVTAGLNGDLFEAGNSEALAEALDRGHADPVRCAQWSRAAREHFEQHLSPAANYEALLRLYQEVVGEVQGRRKR